MNYNSKSPESLNGTILPQTYSNNSLLNICCNYNLPKTFQYMPLFDYCRNFTDDCVVDIEYDDEREFLHTCCYGSLII